MLGLHTTYMYRRSSIVAGVRCCDGPRIAQDDVPSVLFRPKLVTLTSAPPLPLFHLNRSSLYPVPHTRHLHTSAFDALCFNFIYVNCRLAWRRQGLRNLLLLHLACVYPGKQHAGYAIFTSAYRTTRGMCRCSDVSGIVTR